MSNNLRHRPRMHNIRQSLKSLKHMAIKLPPQYCKKWPVCRLSEQVLMHESERLSCNGHSSIKLHCICVKINMHISYMNQIIPRMPWYEL